MADNLDRLTAGAPAARKLPVATSNKIACNKTGGQKRQSSDISRDANLPTDGSLITVKAPKRSATPVPQSFFMANNKKIKMTPNYLPINNTKSNELNQEIPDYKLIKNKENTKRGIKRIPLTQGNEQGQGPAPKKSGTSDSMEIAVRRMPPASGRNKYYLEQFNKFYENYRACNIETASRLSILEINNTINQCEFESLKRRIKVMEQENESLEDKLSQKVALAEVFNQKYINTLKTRVKIEKSFQNKIQEANSLFAQQKAELDGTHSEIGHLRAELSSMQKVNRGMGNELSAMQLKLKEAKETEANLLKQNLDLEEQKIKMQDAATERGGLEYEISQLEFEMKQKALECNKLQLLNDDIANQLEFSQNENETLQNSIAQLEDFECSLIQISEEYYDESVERKETISSLESALSHKAQDLEELAKRHEELKAARHQQLSLHSEEQQKYGAENKNLREIMNNLKAKLQVQAELMQAERESFLVKLDELTKSNSSLNDDIKQMENDNTKLAEEEKNKTKNLKNTILGLKDDLKKEEIKLISLEHEKDGIIRQLNDKINTICCAIKQPIIASSISES